VALYPLAEAPAITAWPQARRDRLSAYREIDQAAMALPDGRQALLLTYNFVTETNAAPTPIVVAAQDLVFVARVGQTDKLVVMTLAVAADDWRHEQPFFQKLLDQMGVKAK